MYSAVVTRQRVVAFLAAIVVTGISLRVLVKIWRYRSTTRCYYALDYDVLPAAEYLEFSPDIRTIFFHVTSCEGLQPRQACAIEAAARTNEQWQVYVLFSAPVTRDTLKTSCLKVLVDYFHNVNFARVHMGEYSQESDLQLILLNDLDRSKHPEAHTADVLKMVTLNKWGGIYLDTDMIVTRSLEDLPVNFVTKADDDYVSAGVLSFGKDDVGSEITEKIIRLMSYKSNFNETELSYAAPMIDSVINSMCPDLVQTLSYATGSVNKCNELAIYGEFYFGNVRDIFQAFSSGENISDRPYVYRMKSDFYVEKNTFEEHVLSTYCPTIYHAYSKEFLNSTKGYKIKDKL